MATLLSKEQNTQNKYITGFSTELFNFLEFIDSLIPTEKTQMIMSKYDKLNMMKIIRRYYNMMLPNKEYITKCDTGLFNKHCFIIPEFDMSFFWQNLPSGSGNQKRVWDTLNRLLIYSKIIIETEAKTPEQQVSFAPSKKKDNSTSVPTTKKTRVNAFVGLEGSKSSDISIENMVNQTKLGKEDCNPGKKLTETLEKTLNINGLSEKLNNMTPENVGKMTEEVQKIIAPHIKDTESAELFKDMLSGIGDELSKTDMTKGNLLENMMHIAEKMSTKMTQDMTDKNCPPEKLMAATQSIMKSFGIPENINPADPMGSIGPETIANMMATLSGGEKIPTGAKNGKAIAMLDVMSGMLGM